MVCYQFFFNGNKNITTESVKQKILTKQLTIIAYPRFQGLIQPVFDISIPILGTSIWVWPNLILIKINVTSKHNPSFLIKSVT